MINCFSFNLLASTLAGTADNGRNFPRINTSPVEILSADVSEPPSSQVKLEISKTEKHRNNNILAEEAAQIFDDEIPVQQKDPNNKNVANCDEKSRSILLGKPQVELAELPTPIKLHFPKEAK